MLRRLISDTVDRTARTNTYEAVGTPLHYIVWSNVAQRSILQVLHLCDTVANTTGNIGPNVYAEVDVTIGTTI